MHLRILALLAAVAAALVVALSAAASTPPPVDARAVIVADGRTGDVLYAENADRRMAMASITKLMTALVTLEHARPGEVVTVSPRAIGKGGSSIFLTAGEQLTVRELLAAALIQSANDAAFALAAHVGDGSVPRFVQLMNEKAAELGLEDTHYVRPDGLDTPGHFSSAEDVLALSRVAMQRPLVRRLVRTKTMQISGPRTLKSWNDLLWRVQGSSASRPGIRTTPAGRRSRPPSAGRRASTPSSWAARAASGATST